MAVTKRGRGIPPKRKSTTTSEDGVEQQVSSGSKPNKRARKGPVKNKNNNNNNKSGLDVQVEEEENEKVAGATEAQSEVP